MTPTAKVPDDQGAALLLAMLIAMLLAALGSGLVALSNTERAVSANHRTGAEVLYAAEAALGSTLEEIAVNPDWSALVAGAAPLPVWDAGSSETSWNQVIDLAAWTAVVQAESNTLEASGPNRPVWRRFASAGLSRVLGGTPSLTLWDPYVIVWVADDASEEDDDPSVDSNGVVMVRAMAISPQGLRRTVQATLRRDAGAVRILVWRETGGEERS